MGKHRTFSLKEKLFYIRKFKKAQKRGETIIGLSRKFGIDRSTIRKWLKTEQVISNARGDWHPEARQMHSGKESFLKPVQAQILCFVFECHEQGIAVSIRLIVEHVKEILLAFKNKLLKAQEEVDCRFIQANKFVHRTITCKTNALFGITWLIIFFTAILKCIEISNSAAIATRLKASNESAFNNNLIIAYLPGPTMKFCPIKTWFK